MLMLSQFVGFFLWNEINLYYNLSTSVMAFIHESSSQNVKFFFFFYFCGEMMHFSDLKGYGKAELRFIENYTLIMI